MSELTGITSKYPYGVDAYEFQSNYEKAELGFAGDVIKSSLRNRLADSVITLENELQGVPKPYNGDMKIICVTRIFTKPQYQHYYYLDVPKEQLDYIAPGGRLDDPSISLVCQFSLRPLTAADAALWSTKYSYENAFNVGYKIEATRVKFSPVYSLDYQGKDWPLCDYIASLIIFRQ